MCFFFHYLKVFFIFLPRLALALAIFCSHRNGLPALSPNSLFLFLRETRGASPVSVQQQRRHALVRGEGTREKDKKKSWLVCRLRSEPPSTLFFLDPDPAFSTFVDLILFFSTRNKNQLK